MPSMDANITTMNNDTATEMVYPVNLFYPVPELETLKLVIHHYGMRTIRHKTKFIVEKASVIETAHLYTLFQA